MAAAGDMDGIRCLMTYMCLSLFFIPIFKMGTEILCEDKLLRTVYQLDEEAGKRIAAGEDVPIREEDLYPLFQRA